MGIIKLRKKKLQTSGAMAIALVAVIIAIGIAITALNMAQVGNTTRQASSAIESFNIDAASERAAQQVANIVFNAFSGQIDTGAGTFATYPYRLGQNCNNCFSVSFDFPVFESSQHQTTAATHCNCMGPGCFSNSNLDAAALAALPPSAWAARLDCSIVVASAESGVARTQEIGFVVSQGSITQDGYFQGSGTGVGDGNQPEPSQNWIDFSGGVSGDLNSSREGYKAAILKGAATKCSDGKDAFEAYVKKYFSGSFCSGEAPTVLFDDELASGSEITTENIEKLKVSLRTVQNAHKIPTLIKILEYFGSDMNQIRKLIQDSAPEYFAKMESTSPNSIWKYLRTEVTGTEGNLELLQMLLAFKEAGHLQMGDVKFESTFWGQIVRTCLPVDSTATATASTTSITKQFVAVGDVSLITSSAKILEADAVLTLACPAGWSVNVIPSYPADFDPLKQQSYFCSNCPIDEELADLGFGSGLASAEIQKNLFLIPASYRFEKFCAGSAGTPGALPIEERRRSLKSGIFRNSSSLTRLPTVTSSIQNFIQRVDGIVHSGTTSDTLVHKFDCGQSGACDADLSCVDGSTKVTVTYPNLGTAFVSTYEEDFLVSGSSTVFLFTGEGGHSVNVSGKYCGSKPFSLVSDGKIVVSSSVLHKKLLDGRLGVSSAKDFVRKVSSVNHLRTVPLSIVAKRGVEFLASSSKVLEIENQSLVESSKTVNSVTEEESLDPQMLGAVLQANLVASSVTRQRSGAGVPEAAALLLGAVVVDDLELGAITQDSSLGCQSLGGKGGHTNIRPIPTGSDSSNQTNGTVPSSPFPSVQIAYIHR